MKELNTTLVQIGDREYRVDDRFKINFSPTPLIVDYRDDFTKENDELWYSIEITELESLGVRPIKIWNRRNDRQFSIRYGSVNPFDNFNNYYQPLSTDTFANLILNMSKARIFDKRLIDRVEIFSTRQSLTNQDIRYYYNTERLIPIRFHTYGFNNTLVAFFKVSMVKWEELLNNHCHAEYREIYNEIKK